VKHAELLQAAFNAYEAKVETILGHTDPFERLEIVKRLKEGSTQGLVNCGVATEGFDCPAVAVVAIARPTKSTSLYMQMIGRGTRPLPGVVDGPDTAEARREAIAASAKTVCTVLDFVGNSGNHKLISVADVLAGDDVDARDLEQAIRIAKESHEASDMDELVEKAKNARETH
jgi:superfamily II DNA or RNA helicase